jgi:hypothetical protein
MPWGSQQNKKDALVTVALKLVHSGKYPIVHRVHNVLLATEVFVRRLD